MDEIKKVSINDANYPRLLKKISNPPKVLYYKGILNSNEKCLAIIGTRKCSIYGKQITLDFSEKISDSGITIASGLAPGIDTYAHFAAVKNNKRTIAVLGTGIDEKSLYPKENIFLSKEIIKTGGCLISEYPPGTKGTKFTFPQRNRIIAGIAESVLIIESKEKGGSLITANFAFKQKKNVFAIPGPIYSFNSKGTNNLIKKGAKLVDSPNDILKELLGIKFLVQNTQKFFCKNPEEKLVLNCLKEEPLCIDKIIERTKLSPEKVASIISIMEIEEKINNLGGNTYAIA